MRQFGDDLFELEEFERTMQWFEAECFVTTDPCEVQRACEAHPEWHLRCVPYGSSDASLARAAEMLHAAGGLDPLPPTVLRACVLETLCRVVASLSSLDGAYVDPMPLHSGDLACIVLESDSVRVLLAPPGLRDASHLANEPDPAGNTFTLIITPDCQKLELQFDRHLALSGVDPAQIKLALAGLLSPGSEAGFPSPR